MTDIRETALLLWRRFFIEVGTPEYADDTGVHCFFCNERQPEGPEGERHKDDCIYVAARGLVEGK